ncbi:MAG: RtcB family protein [Desulfamplus sp.]|nr:RtcB family protein [Desulfamplus sp.]
MVKTGITRNEKYNDMAPYRIWGEDLDPEALLQMDQACSLPVSVRGALMPDAHKGYGLPIGGVLAVDNAVIPYAVGVDIACRVCMTILDTPYSEFEKNRGRFKVALEKQTIFGVGGEYSRPKPHTVMDEDWNFCQIVGSLKDKAWKQLGTSGSGNHFAEFGKLTIEKETAGLELTTRRQNGEVESARERDKSGIELTLERKKVGFGATTYEPSKTSSLLVPGEYLALLTHSGSRGAGAEIASYYSRLAKKLHPELPADLQDLAWLGMDSSEGQEYWMAMELMGRYSAANHEIIHHNVLSFLGAQPLVTINNHHNFAWKMDLTINLSGSRESLSQKVIVHRKGATPAGKGVVGIIPGSMASPAFVVKGLGNPESLDSAAHGAGRRMSRNAAIRQYKWSDLDALLRQKEISLISAGLDEVPMAYKNIEEVMFQQKDLISVIARFDPKLVKMSPPDKKNPKVKKR